MGNEELINKVALEHDGESKHERIARLNREQEERDRVTDLDVLHLDNPITAIVESIGPDAWDDKVLEISIAKAIMNEKWCDLGLLIGPIAKDYLIDLVLEK